MKPQYIQALRKEAEDQAKKILKDKKKFSTKEFDAKHNTTIKRESSLHSLLPQEDINYCINNGIDMWYLYEEMASKYSGDIGNPPKQYYIPTGGKRGRPKKDNNEQE